MKSLNILGTASPPAAPARSEIQVEVLLKVMLRIDSEVIKWSRISSATNWANGFRTRLVAVRDEISNCSENPTLERSAFDYIFQMFLDAMPAHNADIDAEFRVFYYAALLDLKSTSIAATRHLARAYEQLGNFEGAKKCLMQLVRQTKNPAFAQRLSNLKMYLERHDTLIAQLCENAAFLSDSGEFEDAEGSLSGTEIQQLLSEYIENAPHVLLRSLAEHTSQNTQALFAEVLCCRRVIMLGKTPNLKEDQLLSAFDLRDFVQDKTICLVANSQALLEAKHGAFIDGHDVVCLLYTSPSPRDQRGSRMPSSA